MFRTDPINSAHLAPVQPLNLSLPHSSKCNTKAQPPQLCLYSASLSPSLYTSANYSYTVETAYSDHGYNDQPLIWIKRFGTESLLYKRCLNNNKTMVKYFAYSNQVVRLQCSFWVFSYMTTYGETFKTMLLL